ncbi:MAG: exodeoxyribonuclease VII small subunit [Lapillicoccus sp.]
MAASEESGPLNNEGATFADVAELSYEDARDELTGIVAQLEGGQVPLEEGMHLWRRGEALAAHCTAWLDGAQRQISEAGPAAPTATSSQT